tara:strand:- start:10323 stop:11120 length:798 start_codon:yes stop_codon:yes gene_type:complete
MDSKSKTPKVAIPTPTIPSKPKFRFPTEMVDLPSKGIIYASNNPLSSGVIEMKYMTAKEEDIITNQAYIQKGIIVDKLLEALVVSEGVDISDLIVGDKNALLIASRVLGYGANYKFKYGGEDYTADLAALENKNFDESLFTKGENKFTFQTPHGENLIEFQLMTDKTEKKVEAELRGLKKLNKAVVPEMSTRMKHMILSVDGNEDKKDIRDFVDNYFLARDAKALRDYIADVQPDVDFSFERELSNGEIEVIDIPIGANFFFPDA